MSTVQSNLAEDANLVQMNDENQVPREDVVGREHELIIEHLAAPNGTIGVSCGNTASSFRSWRGATSLCVTSRR